VRQRAQKETQKRGHKAEKVESIPQGKGIGKPLDNSVTTEKRKRTKGEVGNI